MLSLPFNFWWWRESGAGGGCVWYGGAVTASIWRYVWPCPLERKEEKKERRVRRKEGWLMGMKERRESLMWVVEKRVGHYTQVVCFKVLRLLLDCPVYCSVLLYPCAGRQKWSNNRVIAIFVTQNLNWNKVVWVLETWWPCKIRYLLTDVWKRWLQSFTPSLCFHIQPTKLLQDICHM